MKYVFTILSILALIVLVGVGVGYLSSTKDVSASVAVTGEYNGTSTRTYNGVPIPAVTLLKTGQGTLGSIVITGANTGIINIYDGTSTVTNVQWSTTTLVSIPASAAAGTYTFDINFTKGLLYTVSAVATAPTSTITWR